MRRSRQAKKMHKRSTTDRERKRTFFQKILAATPQIKGVSYQNDLSFSKCHAKA
ncbi:MAG: hypothetical protein V3T88_05225 [Nitrosomonadaceae bacterium]